MSKVASFFKNLLERTKPKRNFDKEIASAHQELLGAKRSARVKPEVEAALKIDIAELNKTKNRHELRALAHHAFHGVGMLC